MLLMQLYLQPITKSSFLSNQGASFKHQFEILPVNWKYFSRNPNLIWIGNEIGTGDKWFKIPKRIWTDFIESEKKKQKNLQF